MPSPTGTAVEPKVDPVVKPSVPVTVKLEAGTTAAGKTYPVFVMRVPEGVISIRLPDVTAMHTILAHPKIGAIAASLGRKIIEAAEKIPSGRKVISEDTI